MAIAQAGPITEIRGATIIDGTGSAPIPDGVILVRDGRIIAVGKKSSVRTPRGALVVNAAGQFVMPGLIDGHVHLGNLGSNGDGMGSEPTFDGNIYGPEMVARIALNAKADLLSGETTVFDLGGPLEELKQVRDAINAGALVGARMFIAGPAFQEEKNYPPPVATSAAAAFYAQRESEHRFRGPADAAAKVKAAIGRGIDQVKIYQTSGETKGWAGYVENNTLDEVRAMVQEAHRAHLSATAHVRGIAGIKNSMEAGMDSLQHVVSMGWAMPEELVQTVARSKVYVFPTLVGLKATMDAIENPAVLYEDQLALGLPEGLVAELFRTATTPALYTSAILYREGYSEVALSALNLKRLNEAGARIAMGSDAGTAFNFHGTAWKELVAMVNAGLTPMQAIVAATQGSAKAYDKGELGTLEVGKTADIIIVDGDPLRDVSSLKHVVHVFKDGKQFK